MAHDNFEGYEQARRGNSSARYRPTGMVIEADEPITRRTTAQKGAPMQARTTARPQNRTTEDVIVRSSDKRRSLFSRRNMLLGLGSLAATGCGLNYSLAKYDQFQHQIAEGARPATTCDLVCGHGDSATNPTILHAYIAGNRINFVQSLAEDVSKAKLFQSFPFPAYGYTGDPSRVFLEIIPEQLASGKWQILLRATCEDVPLFAQKVLIQLPLVDAGDHFAPPSK